MNKLTLNSLLCVFGIFSASLLSANFPIEEPIESGTGWSILGGGFYSGSNYGLTVDSEDRFFVAFNYQTADTRGLRKLFPAVSFVDGNTYTATFQIGVPVRPTTVSIPSDFFVGFWADTDGTGTFDFDKRIDGFSIVSGDIPVEGEWETWTVSLEIDSTVTTVAGDPIIDAPIGFMVWGDHNTSSYSPGFAFNDLTISEIPEGRYFGAVMAGFVLIFILVRNFRSKAQD